MNTDIVAIINDLLDCGFTLKYEFGDEYPVLQLFFDCDDDNDITMLYDIISAAKNKLCI